MCHEEHQTGDDEADRNDPRFGEDDLDRTPQAEPDHGGGDRADDEEHPQSAIVWRPRCGGEAQQIASVVPNECEQGADVKDCGGGEVRFIHPEQRGDEDEMCTRGYGEKLGESLDETPQHGGDHEWTLPVWSSWSDRGHQQPPSAAAATSGACDPGTATSAGR